MMASGRHLDELDLLGYVEEDLSDEAADRVREHLRACLACRRRVHELEAGREALRRAAPLELPPDRRERIRADLPARDATRRVYLSPLRLASVLAPVAAIAAVVAVVAVVDGRGGGDAEEAAEPAQVERQAEDEEGEAGGAEAATAEEPVASVEGPPARVAAFLRRSGYEARVEGETVVVAGADATRLTRALAELRPGPVDVFSAGS